MIFSVLNYFLLVQLAFGIVSHTGTFTESNETNHSRWREILHRSLKGSNGFDALNDLLKEIEFELGAMEDLNFRVGRNSASVSDLKCYDVRLEDIKVDIKNTTFKKQMILDMEILGLDIECSFYWKFGKNGRGGFGQIHSGGNLIHSQISLWSREFQVNPPTHGTLDYCNAIIEIHDMDFQNGGLLGFFINAFEISMRDPVEKLMQEIACNQFENFVSSDLLHIFHRLNDKIQPYLGKDEPKNSLTLSSLPKKIKVDTTLSHGLYSKVSNASDYPLTIINGTTNNELELKGTGTPKYHHSSSTQNTTPTHLNVSGSRFYTPSRAPTVFNSNSDFVSIKKLTVNTSPSTINYSKSTNNSTNSSANQGYYSTKKRLNDSTSVHSDFNNNNKDDVVDLFQSGEDSVIENRPNGMDTINFMRPSSTLGKFLVLLLKKTQRIFLYLTNSAPIGLNTVFVNNVMKSLFKSAEVQFDGSAFTIQPSKHSGILFDGNDFLTNVKLRLNRIVINGLNEIRVFEFFNAIFPQELNTHVQWGKLSVFLNLNLDLRASGISTKKMSSHVSSVLIDDTHKREDVTVQFDIKDVNIQFSMVLALLKDRVADIPLHSFFHMGDIMTCINSILKNGRPLISGMHISAKGLSHPSINGFLSSGLDRMANVILETLNYMYTPIILNALTQFVEKEGPEYTTEFINDLLIKKMRNSNDNGEQRMCHYSNNTQTMQNGLHNGKNPIEQINFSYVTQFIKEKKFGREQNFEQWFQASFFTRLIADAVNISRTQLYHQQNKTIDRLYTTIEAQEISITKQLVYDIHLQKIELQNFNDDNVITSVSFHEAKSPHLFIAALQVNQRYKPLCIKTIFNFGYYFGQPKNFEWINLETTSLEIMLIADNVTFSTQWQSQIPLKSLSYPLGMLFPDDLSSKGKYAFRNETELWFQMIDLLVTPIENIVLDINHNSPNASSTISQTMSILRSKGVLQVLTKLLIQYIKKIGKDMKLRGSSIFTLWTNVILPALIPSFADENIVFPYANYLNNDWMFLPSMELAELIVLSAGVLITVCVSDNELIDRSINIPDPLEDRKIKNFTSPFFVSLIELNNTFIPSILKLKVVEQFLLDSLKTYFIEHEIKIGATLSLLGLDFCIKSVRILLFDLESTPKVDITGPQEFQSNLIVKDLILEMKMSIDWNKEAQKGRSTSSSQLTTFTIHLRHVHIVMSLLVAIVRSIISDIALDSLLHIDTIIPCLTSTLKFIRINELQFHGNVHLCNITTNTMSSQFEGAIASTVCEALGFLLHPSSSVSHVLQTVVQQAIQNAMSAKLKLHESIFSDKSSCYTTTTIYSENQRFIDFRDFLNFFNRTTQHNSTSVQPYGDAVSWIMQWIRSLTNTPDEDGFPNVNSLVLRPWTLHQSGRSGILHYSKPHLNFESRGFENINLPINFQWFLESIYVENIDSIDYPLRYLEPNPNQEHTLDNEIHFGRNGKPMMIFTDFFLEEGFNENDANGSSNHVHVFVEINQANITSSLIALVNATALLGMPIKQMINPYCLLSTISAPNLDAYGIPVLDNKLQTRISKFDIDFEELIIDIDCKTCPSRKVQNFISLVQAISTGAAKLLKKILSKSMLNLQMKRLLSTSDNKCHDGYRNDKIMNTSTIFHTNKKRKYEPPHFSTISGSPWKALLGIVLSSCSLVILVVGFIFYLKRVSHKKFKEWLLTQSLDRLNDIAARQQIDQDIEEKMGQFTQPMVLSKDILLLVRTTVPLIILLNLGLFISGHLSIGASLNLKSEFSTGSPLHGLESHSKNSSMAKILELSMFESTINMWRGGSHFLAVVVFVCSGAWPYAKQIISLLLWLVRSGPKTKQHFFSISTSNHSIISKYLSIFSKWSMIDIMIMIISLAAFQISIKSRKIGADDEHGSFSLTVFIVPLWGLYANMLAQVLSQAVSAVISHYHIKIINSRKKKIKCDLKRGMDTISTASRSHETSDSFDDGQTNETSSLVDESDSSSTRYIDTVLFEEKNIPSNTMRGEDNVDIFEDVKRSNCDDKLLSMWGKDRNSASLLRTKPKKCGLFQHTYVIETTNCKEAKRVHWAFNMLVGFACVLGMGLLVAGFVLPSFSIQIFGIVGAAMDAISQSSDNSIDSNLYDHSMLGVLRLLIQESSYLESMGHYVGLWLLAFLFLTTSFLIPVALIVILSCLYFLPTKQMTKKYLVDTIGFLQAWQCLEMYILSVLLVTWQLGGLSKSLLNKYCDSLDEIFESLVRYGAIDEDDATCFHGKGAIKEGTYMLFGAAILLRWVTHFVLTSWKQQDNNQILQANDDERISYRKSDDSIFAHSDVIKIAETIYPTPLQFTDYYSCALEKRDYVKVKKDASHN